MEEKTMGQIIAQKRRELGMTQKDLAQQMNVTDKAVSKWERDLSCPDINSVPKLAEVLGISVEELMRTAREAAQGEPQEKPHSELAGTILKAVPLAMGVAVAALSVLNAVEPKDALGMLGIGMACLAIGQFRK